MSVISKTHIVHHDGLVQGTDEWLAARCGLLTASEMKLIITPTLKIASNEKERAHLYELLAQRVTKHVEPHYIGDDMIRGWDDEIAARALYAEKFAPVEEVGFITNDRWGFTIGYSPDGLVGDDGLIEIKSRRQKFQAETIVNGTVPAEHLIQVQTGLLVSGRKWLDYISYCGGMPLFVVRAYPDPKTQDAIIEAAGAFEHRLSLALERYHAAAARMPMTARRVEMEIRI
ncbi:YqaJ-like viral recombinase (plasmid) [Azospirillum baldaniorum]|uniref:YqaJ viral recombinase domain-containing protein n=1 Tax=Azospirillum baldaniorum TaxID=1064539 RepID=A0A9P1NRB7_9PROT|nr:lambda exonuclease family protein [Azospirillum baldaniorum]AWJ93262.1 YqaJ-like viral recombinase [Azospirillum baldaniorum]AWJ93357.1 YqaJ-like viral recombinase [Azospirillum baldaniorum]TWA77956.1 YqaJ-like recombinase protein [Azospirillum brasilense]CCD02944.1 conserved protein of unknown function [Azospirillum baldaniorum]